MTKKQGTLTPTPWGEFCNKYGATVPHTLWASIRNLAETYLTNGSGWQCFLGELAAGCQELSKGKLQEIMCIEDEQSMPLLKPGSQVIYVPAHANGDPTHRDCEQGFVTSVCYDKDIAFVRYWSRHDRSLLRTRINSEVTPLGTLVRQDTRPQEQVDRLLVNIQACRDPYDNGPEESEQ